MIDVVTWVFSKCFDNRRFPGCAADHRGDVNHTAGPTEQTEGSPPRKVCWKCRALSSEKTRIQSTSAVTDSDCVAAIISHDRHADPVLENMVDDARTFYSQEPAVGGR